MNIESLYRLGFSLILLKPKRKQPLDDKWSEGPRVSLLDILDGVDDGCNVGFRPGVTSKTKSGLYIHGIDLDIRIPEKREEAIAAAERLFGRKFLKACARTMSGSGGDSRHFYFLLSRPLRAKTVAHSKDKYWDEVKQTYRWEWEVEIFGEGKQMVLPPSIHPDTGKEYVWLKEPDADLPEMDEDVITTIMDGLTQRARDFDDEDLRPLGVEYDEAEEVLERLDFEKWFIERNGWRNVGMALHHEFGGHQDAYKLWCKFSKRAKNYDAREQKYQWGTFGRNTDVRPIRMATLIKEAAEAEIRDAFQPSEEDAKEISEAIRREKERKPVAKREKTSVRTGKGYFRLDQPKRLLTVPGKLGEIVETYNRSAPRSQPQFAVHAALGIGSTLMGRNWKTDAENYSSIFMLVLGRTASGKEHVLTVISKVLEECELDLVGPTKYTSDAGLMTALEIRPRHVSLADEFSRYLKASRNSGDANMSNAQSALMEVWGRLGGTYRNKGYSGRGMSKAQLEEMASSHVKRPALTLVGVAVPDDFYASIGNEDISNGFLNRFLVCETEIPRLEFNVDKEEVTVSKKFKQWARETAFPLTDEDEDIMDAINRNNAAEPGDAVVVPFTNSARKIIAKIDAHCMAKMDELDDAGMDGLYGRVLEIIMRISLIVARSCESEVITSDHIEWARDYVYYHTEKLERSAGNLIGSSDDQKLAHRLFDIINTESDDDNKLGITVRELITICKPFRNLGTRNREEILKLLTTDFGVRFVAAKRPRTKKTVTVLTTNPDV